MWLVLAFSACLVGCLSKPTFQCVDDSTCSQGGTQGTCQPDSRCSFPDPSCPSGQRYGDLSGAQANQCVGASQDASAPDCLGGSGAFALCITPSTDPVMLAGTLDTDTDPRCTAPPPAWSAAGQPDACMIAGAIDVGNVAVSGAKVLVLAGDAITVTGLLDVASHRGGTTGPGVPFAGCAFLTDPEAVPQGGGGGAGATFKTRGGDGGGGNDVLGGTPALPVADPALLRAGCAGQPGAIASQTAGTAGQGGGAVVLAATAITFTQTGAINASGAGGGGGGSFSGGSGGGSGGMIYLHTKTFTAADGARLIANGGGGAQGASGFTGNGGADPSPTTPMVPAPGGMGGSGGVGGAGFAGATEARAGGDSNNRGGGGGGGGAGYIQSNVPLASITASPTVTIH